MHGDTSVHDVDDYLDGDNAHRDDRDRSSSSYLRGHAYLLRVLFVVVLSSAHGHSVRDHYSDQDNNDSLDDDNVRGSKEYLDDDHAHGDDRDRLSSSRGLSNLLQYEHFLLRVAECTPVRPVQGVQVATLDGRATINRKCFGV